MSIKSLVPMSATVLLLAVAGCEVEKTAEGDLPDVDVSGDAGALPEYEVEKTEEGRMPDVDVDVEAGNCRSTMLTDRTWMSNGRPSRYRRSTSIPLVRTRSTTNSNATSEPVTTDSS